MPFPGEDRYREALAKAEGHESISAMIKVADLKAALAEIERLHDVTKALAATMKDARGAVSSLNTRVDRDKDGDEICIQRNEWVQWIMREILPAMSAAIEKAQ